MLIFVNSFKINVRT